MSDSGPVNVRRVVLVRQPPEQVWTALRDELPRLATLMDGIDSIHRLERTEEEKGIVHTAHEWTATAALPQALREEVDAKALTWIERGRWDSSDLRAQWTVESRLLARGLVGSGSTHIEAAMGGRGARVRFEISTSLTQGGAISWLEGRLKGGIEDTAAAVLAKTLQDLCVAADAFLSGGGARGTSGDGNRA